MTLLNTADRVYLGSSRADKACLGSVQVFGSSSPTDISSLLLAGGGAYGPGSLTVPNYDRAYLVTVSNATIAGYVAGSASTPGISVNMPAPSTPDSTHWMTIQWTITGSNRRVFHNISSNWHVNGDVIEPSATAGSVATITYAWDTTAHGWYVASATGDVLTRTHGPDESTTDLPLYFTPECRALGGFSAIKSAHISALESLPSLVPAYLDSVDQFVEITSDSSGYLYETIYTRSIFDPSWDSGASGRYGPPSVMAYPWLVSNDLVDGKVMLHELGHAWDQWGLSAAGHPYGVAPTFMFNGSLVSGSTNAYDDITITGTFSWFGITIVSTRFIYEPTRTMYVLTDADDNDYPSSWTPRTGAMFRDEQDILELYATVADKPGSYYRSTITEWLAQCFMLCWADHVPGYDPTAHASAVGVVGGSTIFNAFRAYAVSTGVLPSSW
jgi:hypothetical protein